MNCRGKTSALCSFSSMSFSREEFLWRKTYQIFAEDSILSSFIANDSVSSEKEYYSFKGLKSSFFPFILTFQSISSDDFYSVKYISPTFWTNKMRNTGLQEVTQAHQGLPRLKPDDLTVEMILYLLTPWLSHKQNLTDYWVSAKYISPLRFQGRLLNWRESIFWRHHIVNS